MTEYNYDREDIYQPDFRDEYRERHFDRSFDESMYYEYYQDRVRTDNRAADFTEAQRDRFQSRQERLQRLQMYRAVFVKTIYFDSSGFKEYFD